MSRCKEPPARFSSLNQTGFQRSQGGDGPGVEPCQQKTGQNTMGVGTAAGAGAHADFSKDDHAAQYLGRFMGTVYF